jgi:hypothetical protein
LARRCILYNFRRGYVYFWLLVVRQDAPKLCRRDLKVNRLIRVVMGGDFFADTVKFSPNFFGWNIQTVLRELAARDTSEKDRASPFEDLFALLSQGGPAAAKEKAR